MIGWFVIYTKPRQESVAQENLLRQGFETYLPWLRRPRRLRNRRVEVSEPLFTRYLFVRLDPDHRSVAPIRSTTGVTSLVAFGNQLLPVPDAVIHQLRSAEGPDGHVHPPQERSFVSGDIVRIDAGPFEQPHGRLPRAAGKRTGTYSPRGAGKGNRDQRPPTPPRGRLRPERALPLSTSLDHIPARNGTTRAETRAETRMNLPPAARCITPRDLAPAPHTASCAAALDTSVQTHRM